MKYQIYFYETTSGRRPVDEFIEQLVVRVQVKVLRYIELLKTHGPYLGMPFSRPLGRGLFELRVQSQQSVRLIYTIVSPGKLMVIHAFKKTSQKIPGQELSLARERQKGLTSI